MRDGLRGPRHDQRRYSTACRLSQCYPMGAPQRELGNARGIYRGHRVFRVEGGGRDRETGLVDGLVLEQ